MGITDLLCRALQSKSIDILNAMDLVTTTKELLQSLRDNGFEVVLHCVRLMCEKFVIDIPDMSARYMDDNRSVRQKDDISVEHYYHYNVFNSAIDFQLEELQSRFNDDDVELLKLSSALEPKNNFELFDIDRVCTLASTFYPGDFSQQQMYYLRLQLEHYKIDLLYHEKFQNLSTVSELCRQLVETRKAEHYSMIYRLICLVLTLPVSTATTERAFSAMKVVKTVLRTRMEEDYLRDSMIINIEREFAENIDPDVEDAFINSIYDQFIKPRVIYNPGSAPAGVNHHLQSSLFGCALIVNEKQETFEWLFREWLKSMFNVEPKVIITDQDLSICAAIKEVFPNSKHRYCSWHVKKHANEHLHLLNPCNSEFASDYYEWYNANTFEESDRLWKLLTEKYSKEKIKWLLSMHEKREHWLPVHWADIFTAGMTSSQRSESINSFFDGYVHALTPLSEFVEQYNKALIARRKSEKEEDFASLNTTPKSESGLVWQEQAAKLYTRKIYAKFYEQFISSQAYYKDTESKNSGVACYKVGRDGFDKSTWRIVLHDSTCDTFTYSCKMFEREGIFCRHILAIFRLKQVRSIPDKYILRRWTIEARYRGTNISSSFCNQVSNSSTVSPLMLFSLQSKHQKYMKRVALSLSDYTLYDSWLSTQLASSESDMIVGCNKIGSSLPLHETSTSEVSLLVHDPAKPAITKGRPRIASRIKSGAELSLENKQIRQNKCSHCEGKGHNIAGCPIRKGKK